MRLVRIFKIVLSCILVLTLVSCKSTQGITVGKWFDLIYDEMGLQDSQTTLPYFNNIDHDSYYYNIIQSLADWKILDSSDIFDVDELLRQDLYVKTILRIQDIDTDNYLEYAYDNELIKKIDENKIIDKQEAIDTLNKIVQKRNDKEVENKYEVDINDNIKKIDNIEIIDNTFEILDNDIYVKDIIQVKDKYYEVIEVDDKYAKVKEATINNVYESIDISGDSELDLSQSEIIIDENNELFTNYSSDGKFRLSKLNVFKSHSFKYKDYQININITNSRINASIEKALNNKGKMYATISVNGIRPKYRIKMHEGKVEEAYFKVNFISNEALGLRSGIANDLVADFKNVTGDSFFEKCQSLFKKNNEVVEATIPIGSIKIPLPECPTLSLMLRLQLNIYASGRVELALSNEHDIGMEVVNNNFRVINDHKHKQEFVIKANTSTMARLFLGLYLENMDLMDVYVEGGIKSLIQTILHIYDTENKHTLITTDMPMDYVDSAASENDNVYVCGDMDVYMLMNVGINTDNSLLGKLNFKKNIPVLTKNNSSLINNGKNHIENWHFVDKCTRVDRKPIQSHDTIIETEQIKIEKYSILVKEGYTNNINILGLPKGYKMKDIVFESSNDCVGVDHKGIVTGLKKGSSIITIKTKDNKYDIECHILVVDK